MTKMTLVFNITDKEKFKEFHSELLETMISKGTTLEERIGATVSVSAYGDVTKRAEILERMIGIYEDHAPFIPAMVEVLEKQLEEVK